MEPIVLSGHVPKVDPVSTKVPSRPLCFPRPKRFDKKRYLLDLSNCDGFDTLPKSLDEGRRFLMVPCRSLILGSFFLKKKVLDLSLRSLGRVATVSRGQDGTGPQQRNSSDPEPCLYRQFDAKGKG